VLKLHRQAISRVVEPTVAEPEESTEPAEAPGVELNEDHATPLGTPEYGERIDGAATKPGKKNDE
jgi:hypothetical protein